MDFNKNGKDDIQEIADGVKSFISDETTLLIQDAHQAYAWMKGELAGVSTAGQEFLKAALAEAVSKGGSIGDVVANTLTIIYNAGHALVQEAGPEVVKEVQDIKSAVFQQLAGLLIVKAPQ